MTASITPTCFTYTHHENGIHEFEFTESSRKALDEWYAYIEDFYQGKTEEKTVRVLVVQRSGQQPLSYAYKRAMELNRRYPDRPQLRYAFLNDSSGIMQLLSVFISMLRSRDPARYYSISRRDEAIAWLLSE